MALVESLKYGLSSPHLQNTRKSDRKAAIFVKLTDSALRAIEEFLKFQHKTGQQATLKFLGNEGRINVPGGGGCEGVSFDFSLSCNSDVGGPSGSFECVELCGSRSLESMGSVPFKMRILAKDDVYDATRLRMKEIEELKKSECAKEIEQNDSHLRGGKKTLWSSTRRDSPGHNNNNNNNNSSSTHNPFSRKYERAKPPRPETGSKPEKPPHLDTINITRRPLRDRLIHMLAVKTYKKPELYSKISKEGLKDKDKKLLMSALAQVSHLKDNVYHLSRGMWNDVNEEWPFWSEQERVLMRRNKPENLTPPGSDCSMGSSGSSPRSGHSSASSSLVSPGCKRPGEDGDGRGGKRTRVSHFKQRPPSPPSPRGVSPGVGKSPEPWPPFDSSELAWREKDSDESDSVDSGKGSSSAGSTHAHKQKESPDSSPDDTSDDIHKQPLYSNNTNYLAQFGAIRSVEERARYKREFNAEYAEYRDLHSVIDKVKNKFAQLEERLRSEEPGSHAYAEVREEIIREYHLNKRNRRYQEAKEKFSYLHEKLAHIKAAVAEYDGGN